MRTLDVSDDQARTTLAELAAHLPAGTGVGRVLVVAPGQVLTDTGMWWTDDGAARLVELPCGCCAELTRWRDGAEISRVVGAAG